MAEDNLIQLEINEQAIEARPGELLIEVADANGVKIPRFCYHRKLSVSANCRMCLVEIENSPKPMPACATPVAEGMKVYTNSEKVIKAQKSVMEFLLINHPLDCPICDQGGECDLQDLSVAYGTDFSRYNEKKRVVVNKKLGPLVSTDMTRCIHCTRCVRFGKEIAGIVELGGIGRGEHMEIDTYVEKSLSSELSGNIIDICPVGALTSKPFRYKARGWELTTTKSIAPHDALGSNILIQTINNKVVRVLPDENEAVNEIWLSDRDRFSYLGLDSEDRCLNPMLRQANGELESVDWETALEFVADKLKEIVSDNPHKLAALVSPNSTLEEMHLLNKIMCSLGSDKIDHRLRQSDFGYQIPPGLSCKIADIENMDSILLVGFDAQKEVPLLGHRIRKATGNGAIISALNPQNFNFSFKVDYASDSATEMLDTLSALAKTCFDKNSNDKYSSLGNIDTSTDVSLANNIYESLSQEKTIVLVGQYAIASNQYSKILALAEAISDMTKSDLGLIDSGANAAGAWVTGCVNQEQSPTDMLNTASGIILSGLELGEDVGNNTKTNLALSGVGFVVSLTSFLDDTSNTYADVVLPIAAFSETSGTFINMQGDKQSFKGALKPKGDAKPAWKVLRVLANQLDIGGFDFMSSIEVLKEANSMSNTTKDDWQFDADASISADAREVANIYDTDALVRRAKALQATVLAKAKDAD